MPLHSSLLITLIIPSIARMFLFNCHSSSSPPALASYVLAKYLNGELVLNFRQCQCSKRHFTALLIFTHATMEEEEQLVLALLTRPLAILVSSSHDYLPQLAQMYS